MALASSVLVKVWNMEGLRVVRGPDWKWGSQDGGEGFVGTIVSRKEFIASDERLSQAKSSSEKSSLKALLGKQLCVKVIWDNGHDNTYRVGAEGAFDLRVVDIAAIGIRHGKPCEECNADDIIGFLWACKDCEMSICSSCFLKGSHDPLHTSFRRIDTPSSDPFIVHRKPQSEQIELNGIFPGALVKRGHDWENGDIDVQEDESGIGQVKESHNLPPGFVRVEWAGNKVSNQKVGASGKASLLLYKHAKGGSYVPDHLPILKSSEFDEASFANNSIVKFAVGDKVMVINDAAKLERFQDKKHGGWIEDMQQIVGKEGTIVSINENNFSVHFLHVRSFFINPAALKRTTPYSIGQPVRIKIDEDTTESMIKAGLSDDAIEKVVGETGCIMDFNDDGSVQVKIDGLDGDTSYKLHNSWIEIFSVKEHVRSNLATLEKNRTTVFLDAAANGELSALKQLVVDYRTSVNKRNEDGKTALHAASQHGRITVITWLVRRGADINLEDCQGRSAIHHAANSGQHATIKHLIRLGAKLDKMDYNSMTPLQLATRFGCKKSVKVLVSHGCDVNAKDSDGDTALHNSIYWEAKDKTYRDYKIVDYLVEKSDLTITNLKNLNALLFAAHVPNRRVLKLLLNKHGEKLLDAKTTSSGYTVLHVCCSKGDLQGVKICLEQLREITIRSPGSYDSYLETLCNRGFTPLLVAADNGHYKVVEFLAKNGANLKAKTEVGDTAVHLVAAQLRNLKELPTKRDSPHIFKIYNELSSDNSDVVKSYPALSMMCFLVHEGCPWINPGSSLANRAINSGGIRAILSRFSNARIEEETGIETGRIVCILCGTTEIPGVIEGCNHKCNNICKYCVFQVAICPNEDCRSPNAARVLNFEELENTELVAIMKSIDANTTNNCKNPANSNTSQQHNLSSASDVSEGFLLHRNAVAGPMVDQPLTASGVSAAAGEEQGRSVQFNEQVGDSRDRNPTVICTAALGPSRLMLDSASNSIPTHKRGFEPSKRASESSATISFVGLPAVTDSLSDTDSSSSDSPDVVIPISEITKVENRNGKQIIKYDNCRFSKQRNRGENVTVYQCTATRPSETKLKCRATIDEIYDENTQSYKYVKGPIDHEHAERKRSRKAFSKRRTERHSLKKTYSTTQAGARKRARESSTDEEESSDEIE